MNELDLGEIAEFFELPRLDFGSQGLKAFSLNPVFYEQEVAKRNGGLDLSNRAALKRVSREDERHYSKVSRYLATDEDTMRRFKQLDNLMEAMSSFPGTSSLLVEDFNELGENINRFYQVAYAHYVLGVREVPDFPYVCCGISARNVVFALFAQGYPMASYMDSLRAGHAYVGVPFIISNSGEKGTVIIDPTSDQLWDKRVPRNMVTVMPEGKWEYKSDWARGTDAYPDGVADLGIFRKIISDRSFRIMHGICRGVDKFFPTAFANPLPHSKA